MKQHPRIYTFFNNLTEPYLSDFLPTPLLCSVYRIVKITPVFAEINVATKLSPLNISDGKGYCNNSQNVYKEKPSGFL